MTADVSTRPNVLAGSLSRERQAPSADRKINSGQAAAALLTMILCAVAAVMLFSRSQATVMVWESTRDLVPGVVVQASDVAMVELPAAAPVRAVDATSESLVGTIVRIDVPAGTLLNDSMVLAGDVDGGAVPTVGRVGLVLEANQYPEGVSVGDSLRIIEVNPGAAVERGFAPLSDTLIVSVLNVTESPGNSSELWITVAAPLEFVDRLALMSSLEQVATAKVG